MKTANILLDDNWVAKICDFGLSKTGPTNQTSNYIRGTPGYVDPDYCETLVPTQKTDVYMFGVIMLEVLCVRKAVDVSFDDPNQHVLTKWAQECFRINSLAQIVDTNLVQGAGAISARCLDLFVQLAMRCLLNQANERPTMANVVAGLETILATQEKANTKCIKAMKNRIFGGIKVLSYLIIYIIKYQMERRRFCLTFFPANIYGPIRFCLTFFPANIYGPMCGNGWPFLASLLGLFFRLPRPSMKGMGDAVSIIRCHLPSNSSAQGVLFFGTGPYFLLPQTDVDLRSYLSYTPLLKHPDSFGYYIGVDAIVIKNRSISVPTNTTTKLSTIDPYTILRSDIYNSVVRRFSLVTKRIRPAKPVAPFGLCYNTSAKGTKVTITVPGIDLSLQDGKKWTIATANSIKQVTKDVACLAFVDGGATSEPAIVIGTFQFEDTFLHFDLENSTFGFSSSLLSKKTSCSNFNFTLTHSF
ncbi:aspartic peptidase A1 family, Aspartic peptidase domain, Xylanase inhibitor [Artemisia annua]|uniref:Aspartic peptidase A1 family, Aspartic peptidase domain, Xylanase inhibitor n=1 Tax=Artemisia annua TaxID=35608 RepID=A0A2U1KV86_ARTAN|nr:aspartic peptidase A1 family, Aspartic peptidase domain, Xylanase inhibitor [Artemisia annua]